MSDLRAGVDIVLHATRTGSGDLVSGRWNKTWAPPGIVKLLKQQGWEP